MLAVDELLPVDVRQEVAEERHPVEVAEEPRVRLVLRATSVTRIQKISITLTEIYIQIFMYTHKERERKRRTAVTIFSQNWWSSE